MLLNNKKSEHIMQYPQKKIFHWEININLLILQEDNNQNHIAEKKIYTYQTEMLLVFSE